MFQGREQPALLRRLLDESDPGDVEARDARQSACHAGDRIRRAREVEGAQLPRLALERLGPAHERRDLGSRGDETAPARPAFAVGVDALPRLRRQRGRGRGVEQRRVVEIRRDDALPQVRGLSRVEPLRRKRQAGVERLLPEFGDERLPRQCARRGPRARARGERRAVVHGDELARKALVGRDERGAASSGCESGIVHATSRAERRNERARAPRSQTLAAGGLRR